MKTLPNIPVFLLILLVAAPLDSAVASWMALGMEAHIATGMAAMSGDSVAHQHAVPGTGDSAAHHDAENCDEHCMNCSSHCFSSVVIASSALEFHADGQHPGSLSSQALYRAYLLFRPPIAG